MRSHILSLVACAALYGCGEETDDDQPESEPLSSPLDAGATLADGAATSPLDAARSLDATFLDVAYVSEPEAKPSLATDGATRDAASLPYARVASAFHEGASAGFGRERYPEVIFGPPQGKGSTAGSLDVLSLGVGGELVVDFGERGILDGSGADFIVFENPFWPSGDSTSVYAELGEVSVSSDLLTWATFACDPRGAGQGRYPGCAGWTPTLVYDPFAVVPLDPAVTGGDAFDLGELGVARARYVRIRDLAQAGEGDAAGFDLDAIGVIHREQ